MAFFFTKKKDIKYFMSLITIPIIIETYKIMLTLPSIMTQSGLSLRKFSTKVKNSHLPTLP